MTAVARTSVSPRPRLSLTSRTLWPRPRPASTTEEPSLSLSSWHLPVLPSSRSFSTNVNPPPRPTSVYRECVCLCYLMFTNLCSPRFTNSGFNQPLAGIRRRTSEPDQELSSVQVVRQGTTVGYDNPGFESPWNMPRGTGFGLYELESPDISSSDAIVCSGSSTPATFRPPRDSAHQEPSSAPSLEVRFTSSNCYQY